MTKSFTEEISLMKESVETLHNSEVKKAPLMVRVDLNIGGAPYNPLLWRSGPRSGGYSAYHNNGADSEIPAPADSGTAQADDLVRTIASEGH